MNGNELQICGTFPNPLMSIHSITSRENTIPDITAVDVKQTSLNLFSCLFRDACFFEDGFDNLKNLILCIFCILKSSCQIKD